MCSSFQLQSPIYTFLIYLKSLFIHPSSTLSPIYNPSHSLFSPFLSHKHPAIIPPPPHRPIQRIRHPVSPSAGRGHVGCSVLRQHLCVYRLVWHRNCSSNTHAGKGIQPTVPDAAHLYLVTIHGCLFTTLCLLLLPRRDTKAFPSVLLQSFSIDSVLVCSKLHITLPVV